MSHALQVRPEDFSGKMTVRVPLSLHYRIHKRAEEEGVSFNTMTVTILSEFVGAIEAEKTERNFWGRFLEWRFLRPTATSEHKATVSEGGN